VTPLPPLPAGVTEEPMRRAPGPASGPDPGLPKAEAEAPGHQAASPCRRCSSWPLPLLLALLCHCHCLCLWASGAAPPLPCAMGEGPCRCSSGAPAVCSGTRRPFPRAVWRRTPPWCTCGAPGEKRQAGESSGQC